MPPALPGLRVAVAGRPFHRRGQVADHRVVPDVYPLALAQVVDGKLDSPVQVPGDGSILKALVGPAGGRVEDVGAPAPARLEPGTDPFGEVRVAEVEVFGRAQLGNGPADLRSGLDQVGGVEGGAAVLALVPAGPVEAAMGALSLDVAVGQEPLADGVVVLLGHPPVDEAVLQLHQEHVLGDGGVVGGPGGGVEVPRDPEGLPLTAELGVVAIDDLSRGDSLGVGPDRDGRAVHVGSAHHQHVVAGQALVAGVDVGWKVGPGQVAEMAASGRVGPRNRDKYRHPHRHGEPHYPQMPRSSPAEVSVFCPNPKSEPLSTWTPDLGCRPSGCRPAGVTLHERPRPMQLRLCG